MSFFLASSSRNTPSSFPSSYDAVRPHHLLVLYGVYYGFWISGLSQKIANQLLSCASRFSDYMIPLIQYGVIPDFLIRYGIRLRLRDQLVSLSTENDVETELAHKMEIVQQLSNMPIAVETDAANQQHYEVPSAFYDLCLGVSHSECMKRPMSVPSLEFFLITRPLNAFFVLWNSFDFSLARNILRDCGRTRQRRLKKARSTCSICTVNERVYETGWRLLIWDVVGDRSPCISPKNIPTHKSRPFPTVIHSENTSIIKPNADVWTWKTST